MHNSGFQSEAYLLRVAWRSKLQGGKAVHDRVVSRFGL